MKEIKIKSMFMLSGLAVGLLVSMSASAALINDGFEGDTATPDFTGDYDPASWNVTEDYTASIMVFSDTTTGASSDWIHSGNNALRFKASGARGLSQSFTGTEKVAFEFWTYAPAINSGFRTLNFGLKDTAGSNVGPNLSFNGTAIQYHDGSSWNSIVDFVTDRYAQVIVNADGSTKTFTLDYDGTLYDNGGAGYAFYNNVGLFGQAYFSFSQDYREAYLDDVSVTAIPEAATLGLFGVAAFLLLLRKKAAL